MSDTPKRVQCHNCEENALYFWGHPGEQVPLCLDCYLKVSQHNLDVMHTMQRQLNHLFGHAEVAVGLGPFLPRIEVPEPTHIHTGAVTLNNINVTNSTVGVLNTGTIQSVDSSISSLKQSGAADTADAIVKLTEALINCVELSNAQKDSALELLGAVATEAVKPAERRQKAVGLALLGGLKEIAVTVTALAGAWSHAAPLLHQLF